MISTSRSCVFISEVSHQRIDPAESRRVVELIDGRQANDRHGHYSTLHHLPRVLVELYRAVDGDSARERDLSILFRCPPAFLCRVFLYPALPATPVQPDDRTLDPCPRAFRLAPRVRRRGGQFLF